MLLPFISIKADDSSTRLSSEVKTLNDPASQRDVNTIANEKMMNIIQGRATGAIDDFGRFIKLLYKENCLLICSNLQMM